MLHLDKGGSWLCEVFFYFAGHGSGGTVSMHDAEGKLIDTVNPVAMLNELFTNADEGGPDKLCAIRVKMIVEACTSGLMVERLQAVQNRLDQGTAPGAAQLAVRNLPCLDLTLVAGTTGSESGYGTFGGGPFRVPHRFTQTVLDALPLVGREVLNLESAFADAADYMGNFSRHLSPWWGLHPQVPTMFRSHRDPNAQDCLCDCSPAAVVPGPPPEGPATAEAEEAAAAATAEARARAALEAQPANVLSFTDPAGDVVECGSTNLVADPKADLLGVNVGSTQDGAGTVISVILPGFVDEILKDFSFAVVVFTFSQEGGQPGVHLLETHAGVRRQGELDPNTNEPISGTEDRVRSEGDQARFDVPQPMEKVTQVVVRTFHMPQDGDKVRCDEAGPFTVSQ